MCDWKFLQFFWQLTDVKVVVCRELSQQSSVRAEEVMLALAKLQSIYVTSDCVKVPCLA